MVACVIRFRSGVLGVHGPELGSLDQARVGSFFPGALLFPNPAPGAQRAFYVTKIGSTCATARPDDITDFTAPARNRTCDDST